MTTLLRIFKRLDSLQWLPVTLARISVGVLFFESGRGKLFYKLNELKEYFVQWASRFPMYKLPW